MIKNTEKIIKIGGLSMLATQHNEWINVKDSLPNKDCMVLILEII